MPTERPYKICIEGDPNEIAVGERGREGEGEEEGAVGGRDPEAHEGEDGQGDE